MDLGCCWAAAGLTDGARSGPPTVRRALALNLCCSDEPEPVEHSRCYAITIDLLSWLLEPVLSRLVSHSGCNSTHAARRIGTDTCQQSMASWLLGGRSSAQRDLHRQYYNTITRRQGASNISRSGSCPGPITDTPSGHFPTLTLQAVAALRR